jgi:antitoxin CcdA
MPAPAARPEATRRPINVSLNEALVAEAKALGINISRAAESGLEQAVKNARDAKWLEENRAAIEAHNAWVEEHGLILDEYRQI